MKEHIPKCDNICIKDKPKKISTTAKNVIKWSGIAVYLIKHSNYAELYE